MSNPTPTPEQPPAISAAELRRRLLAAPPPGAAPAAAAEPEPEPVAEEVVEPEESYPPGTAQELLARLRLPGKSGAIPVPASRPTLSVPLAADPAPPPRPSSRRTPLGGALNQFSGLADGRYLDDAPHEEVHRLKAENKELRSLLREMKQLLQEASETEQKLTAKDKEFAEAVAAKDAQIEELSTQLGAIEEQIAKGELAPPPPVPKTRTELEEWSDELEKEAAKLEQERKKLDVERQQLREDEEALEKQMREMEVAMARERAMIARQETELRRLSAEIQHELDVIQRGDANLREQMAKFQRRAQEVLTKSGGAPNNGRR